MAIDIERILRLTADYHNFCLEQIQNTNRKSDPDELTADDLDLIAAAANIPENGDEKKQNRR